MFSSYCCSSYGAGFKPPSAPWICSLAPSLGTLCSVQWMAESIHLYLSGSGRASQETAISGSCQQNLVGIRNSVWVWWCLWDGSSGGAVIWMACSTVCALHFVSVSPPMGILFPLLKRIEVSTLWSSFFLSSMCFTNCILGILRFWANIKCFLL